MGAENHYPWHYPSYCLLLGFVAALFLALAAFLLVFAAFFLGSAAAVLAFVLAALVSARLAAVHRIGAVGAVVGSAGGVGAGALMMMALVLAHLGLSGAVHGLFSGGVVVASGHTESESGSHKSS